MEGINPLLRVTSTITDPLLVLPTSFHMQAGESWSSFSLFCFILLLSYHVCGWCCWLLLLLLLLLLLPVPLFILFKRRKERIYKGGDTMKGMYKVCIATPSPHTHIWLLLLLLLPLLLLVPFSSRSKRGRKGIMRKGIHWKEFIYEVCIATPSPHTHTSDYYYSFYYYCYWFPFSSRSKGGRKGIMRKGVHWKEFIYKVCISNPSPPAYGPPPPSYP